MGRLYQSAAALAAAGDVEAARAVHETITKLLGVVSAAADNAVIDLAKRRPPR
ncbi:hypothetical protein BH11MYX4_BH11MYX4_42010 [soil metagenome]